jgi:hypothetical protein
MVNKNGSGYKTELFLFYLLIIFSYHRLNWINEIETKRNETKSTKTKRNETKSTKTKRNETKWNETNEIDWYEENGRKKIKDKTN